jgi:ubiquinone/menaquinone biosynthesis C-methylase UbiE
MFVEIGAGLRFTPADNVVAVEIYDYPSTDVLAVAESLPFEDGTFDGALALNVLEHVRDPFRCARELCRVVKPGGRVYVMLPFIAAEHGYPSHYFNATRFGVREFLLVFQRNRAVASNFRHLRRILDQAALPCVAAASTLEIHLWRSCGVKDPDDHSLIFR